MLKVKENLLSILNKKEIWSYKEQKIIFIYYNQLKEENYEESVKFRNLIAEKNIQLVTFMAKGFIKYTQNNSNIEFNDIFNEGFLGLLKAIDKFDYTLGFSFSTYATNWIKSYIQNYIFKNKNSIRIPNNKNILYSKINIFMSDYFKENHEFPDEHLIMNKFGISKKDYDLFIQINNQTIISSNEEKSVDNNSSIINNISDENYFNQPEELFIQKETKDLLLFAIRQLPELEKKCIIMYFYEDMDYNQIAEELNMDSRAVYYKINKTLKVLNYLINNNNIEISKKAPDNPINIDIVISDDNDYNNENEFQI